MALLAYNLTTIRLPLNGVPSVILPASQQAGKQGQAYNVTSELRVLSEAVYAQLQVQVTQRDVVYVWDTPPVYDTPGLTTESPDEHPTPAPPPDPTPPPVEYPVIVRVVQLDEPPEGEQGLERAIEIFPALEFPLRILLVTGAITRGAPGAQVYLCCHTGGAHELHSDRFDASQPGVLQESAHIEDRVVEAGEDLFIYCTTDYVRGYLTLLIQRVAT